MSRLLVGCILSWMITASVPGQERFPCEPSPEIREALAALPDERDQRLTFEERMEPLRRLLEKHPGNLFLEHEYQKRLRVPMGVHWREMDAARARYRSRPDDPLFRYLEARLMLFVERDQSVLTLEALLGDHPDFVWPLLALIEVAEPPAAGDAAQMAVRLRAFVSRCPSSLAAYDRLSSVSDTGLLGELAERLRTRLEQDGSEVPFRYWAVLWQAESRAAPRDRQDDVRRRILADVAKLREQPPVESMEWLRVFQAAHNLTGDDALRDWYEETSLRRFPGSSLAVVATRHRWDRENPWPRSGSREEVAAHDSRRFAALRGWLRRWPGDIDLNREMFRYADPRAEQELSVEERLSYVDARERVCHRSPELCASVPPVPTQIADLYVRLGVRLDRIPALLDEGRREHEQRQRYRTDPVLLASETQSSTTDRVDVTRERTQLVLADYHLATGQLERAREIILAGEAESSMPSTNPQVAARRQVLLRPEWLYRRARLAERENTTDEALDAYQRLLATVPRRMVETGDLKTEALRTARSYYLRHGGTEEGWIGWATERHDRNEREALRRPVEFVAPMPAFSKEDLHGRIWTLADVQGKATYVNFWATWCGPCRADHPDLEALHKRLAERPNMQVLTVSIDDNPHLAERYVKEKGYTFPVIVDREFANLILPIAGIPISVVVDARGRRSSYYPIQPHPVAFEQILSDLDRAAAARE